MVDLASIGYRVDTSGLQAGNTALDQFAAKNKQAGQAAKDMGATTQVATPPVTAMGKAATVAAEAHKGLSSQAMAAGHSVRSMAEMIAMGSPPTQILASQLNHLSYAATGPGGLTGAFRQVGSSLSGLITPMTLMVGTLAAVGVAGYLLYTNWKNSAFALDDAARSAGVTVARMRELEATAAFKGIDSDAFVTNMEKFAQQVYLAKNGMGDLEKFFRANNMQASTFDEYLLKASDLIKNATSDVQRQQLLQQMGLPSTMQWVRYLSQGSEAIQQAAKDAKEFATAADEGMIARAREFDEKWDRAVKNTSNAMKAFLVASVEGWNLLGDAAERAILKMRPNVGVDLLRGAAAGQVSGTKTTAADTFAQFYSATNYDRQAADYARHQGRETGGGGRRIEITPGPQATIDPKVLQDQLSKEQQRIAALGTLATVEETVRQKEIEVQLARLNGIPITERDSKAIENYARLTAIGVMAIRQQVDAQKIEAATVGMSAGAAAAYRAEQEKLADFRNRGIQLTKDQAAALHQEAQALGEATQAAKEKTLADNLMFERAQIGRSDTEQQVYSQLRSSGISPESSQGQFLAQQIRINEALKATSQIGQEALKGFISDLRAGKSAGEAFTNMLNRIADKLIDMQVNNLVSGLLGKASPGLGGLFGGAAGAESSAILPSASFLSHGFGFAKGGIIGHGGEPRWVHPAYFDDAPRMRKGGMLGPDEVPVIGHVGERVVPAGQSTQPVQNNIQVINNAGADVTTSTPKRNASGGLDLQVAIDKGTGRSISSGAQDGVMGLRFGTRRVVEKR